MTPTRSRNLMRLAALAAPLAVAATSNAAIYHWDFQKGDPGAYGIKNKGGKIETIDATFDSTTNQLSWSVSFSNTVTKGLTLAVSNGPNPKGHAGELALLYVDANDPQDVRITAYNYNGKNSKDSYKDGNGNKDGNQTADLIASSDKVPFVLSASREDAGGWRTIKFTLDASIIQNHTPMYPGATPWSGLAFDTGIGLWMHTFRTFNPTYDAQTGGITNLGLAEEGYIDGRDFTAEIVPSPGAGALAALGLAAALRRRRAG